jgi:WhiB family transcriptional regulator, redox-sensing transcriptional regulator
MSLGPPSIQDVDVSVNFRLSPAQNWLEQAACRGEDGALFYPPNSGESRAERQMRENMAKSICQTCQVKPACLSHAVTNDERYGIWGGLNDLERRDLQRSA